jgi:adenosylcobinamide-GDP ribazoletransferase
MNYIHSALVALQFLTQVPVYFKKYPNDQTVAGSLIFYPLIGLLIGTLLAVMGASMAMMPNLLSAALILLVWIVITGALHLDGLADSCDAWLGGQGDKQRTLEIMKDPCSGPVAVVVLLATLLLKFTAIVALLEMQAFWLIAMAPFIARALLPILLLSTPYVRSNGIGSVLVKYAPHLTVYIACSIAIIISLNYLSFTTVIAAFVTVFALRGMMLNRIDGLTGDTAGACVEIVEVVVLIGCVFTLY